MEEGKSMKEEGKTVDHLWRHLRRKHVALEHLRE